MASCSNAASPVPGFHSASSPHADAPSSACSSALHPSRSSTISTGTDSGIFHHLSSSVSLSDTSQLPGVRLSIVDRTSPTSFKSHPRALRRWTGAQERPGSPLRRANTRSRCGEWVRFVHNSEPCRWKGARSGPREVREPLENNLESEAINAHMSMKSLPTIRRSTQDGPGASRCRCQRNNADRCEIPCTSFDGPPTQMQGKATPLPSCGFEIYFKPLSAAHLMYGSAKPRRSEAERKRSAWIVIGQQQSCKTRVCSNHPPRNSSLHAFNGQAPVLRS